MIRKSFSKALYFYNQANQLRQCSTRSVTCQEIRIPVPWGHVAGKWWGPTDRRPVLCLHGWQDNCGSFDRLIPLLHKDIAYLAVDLPGHGYSSHLPSGMFYHQSVYYLFVNYIAEYFHWDHVSLLGHSLGGITSFTYTMLFPNKVDFLICLDGSKPMNLVQSASTLAEQIVQFMKFAAQQRSHKEPPSYTWEEIKQRVSQAQDNSIDIRYSHYVALRNIMPSKLHPNKYYFARDPRLKVIPLLNWEQRELVNNVLKMTVPMLIVKALGGSYFEPKEFFYEVMDAIEKVNKDFELIKLPGTHHLHLNNPEELSVAINKFFDKYYKEDTSKGGIKESIIYEEPEEKKRMVEYC